MLLKNGVVLSMISSLSFAVVGWLVAFYNGGLSPPLLLFYRSLFTSLFILPWVWKELRGISKTSLKLFLMRGLFGGVAIIIYFFNVGKIGPSLSANFLGFASIFSLGIGVLVNRERVSRIQIIGIGLCNAGIAIMATKMQEVSAQDVILGLSGAFFAALSVNSAKLARESNLSSNGIYAGFSLATLIAAMPFIENNPAIPNQDNIAPILFMVLAAWTAQVSLTGAYVALGNAKASALGRLIVVWAFGLELWSQPSSYTHLKLLVCLLTLGGSVMIALGHSQDKTGSVLKPT
jgi:drug/metabolite transporter (DMT)-like permease